MTEVLPIKDRELVLSRYYSDGIYRDKAKEFTKLLQIYDRKLLARWLWDKQRWSIWTRDRRGLAYLVYVCVVPGTEEYREIGMADIKFIGKMDNYRKQKGYNILKEVEENNTKITDENKKQLHNRIMDSCHERWRQFKGNPMIPVGISF